MAAASPRRTKIVATIGPASASPDVVAELARAGMDGARLNLSHGTHDEHRARARLVRATEAEIGRPLALIADLQGPKLRVGDLESPISLARGEDVVVIGGESSVNGELPVSPPVISEVLQPGHEVLIDDGLVRLRVERIERGRAQCAVLTGGIVASHKGVNLPGVPIPIPSLTRKDMDDLELALELGVDFIALSFVRSPADVRDLRALIEQAGSHAHVIAKIEKAEAVDALDAILDEADAVMVARGDLGVEIGAALVPLLQKRIIIAALDRGKPVITATQMLESMVHSTRPTRAEVADVANAIFDGTDAVMLSQETAVGKHPVLAVQMMASIAQTIERELPYGRWLAERGPQANNQYHAIAFGAVGAVYQLGLKCIVSPTNTGTTAALISAYRPKAPVLALSPRKEVVRRCRLLWGVHPRLNEEPMDTLGLIEECAEVAEREGFAQTGDKIGITAGLPAGSAGGTNLFKVHTLE